MDTTHAKTAPFTIVVGNDLTAASAYAFEHATRIARRIDGCDIHVVHVIEGVPNEERATELGGRVSDDLKQQINTEGWSEPICVGIHVRWGRPARELAQFAKDAGADMIVVGAPEGPHQKQLGVGSVAERLLLAAPCPVVVAGPMPDAEDAAHEPKIEPPCPDCVLARRKSAAREWWCARHSEHHARAHTYSFRREFPLQTHDSSVTPTGVDMT